MIYEEVMNVAIDQLEHRIREAEDAGYLVQVNQTVATFAAAGGLVENLVMHSVEVYKRVL